MTTAPPESKPTRRGLWLAVAVVVGLLALTTWDTLRNSDRSSPAALRRAAFDGDEATVRRLSTAHPEWIDMPGSTNGQTRVLDGLYDKTMSALGKPSASVTHADLEKVFREWEAFGATPLFHAVVRKHVGTARLLVEARANVRAKLTNGQPLVFMVTLTGDTNLLAMLEARGARLDEPEPRSTMMLIHYAIHSGREEMLRFLIGRGLSVNATNSFGYTPLHLAAMQARLDLVQVLAMNGADLGLIDNRGHTALVYARTSRSPNATAVVTWLETYAATNQPPTKPAP